MLDDGCSELVSNFNIIDHRHDLVVLNSNSFFYYYNGSRIDLNNCSNDVLITDIFITSSPLLIFLLLFNTFMKLSTIK